MERYVGRNYISVRVAAFRAHNVYSLKFGTKNGEQLVNTNLVVLCGDHSYPFALESII
jgi:hypothetical protein